MDSDFAFMTPDHFTRAKIYPGSVGTFRYRVERTGWLGTEDARLRAWVYENICFELAKDVEQADFPWTEEGVAALRAWLREKLHERGAEPYRVPYPAPAAE